MGTRLTVLPYLLAMAMAIQAMPLNIFDVHARNIGTVETEPWRSKLTAMPAAKTIVAIASRVREWCSELVSVPLIASEVGEAAIDLLVPGASRLKGLRQAKADLQADLKAVNREIAAIGDAITVANLPMNDEQRAQMATLTKKKAAIQTRIEDNETFLAAAEEQNEQERTAAAAQPNGDTQASTAATQVVAGKDRAEDDPKRGFRTPREFMLAVMSYGRSRKMDARLKPLHQQATAGSDEQSGFSDPYGGFLLPVAFSPDLLKVQAEGDPTADKTRKLPMAAPMVKINARVDKNHSTSVSGGLTVTRHPEAVTGTSSRMQFEQIGMEAHELLGLAYATESIMQDSPTSFAALLAEGFKDEFDAKILDEKINGTGAGEYLGVLASPALVSVTKETGQAAATIVKENIDAMAARCWRYGQAIYLANHNTRKQLRSLVQKVGTGGAPVPYFTQGDGQEYLDGRPIYFTEFAKTLGTQGDLILGVWSEYLEGLYQSMQQAESIHVRFEQHERAFKFWLRNDGMPWWRSVLTPRNGDTLSPFVVLDTRS